MEEIFVIDLLKNQLIIKNDLGQNKQINFYDFNWLNPNPIRLKGSILNGTPFFRCKVDVEVVEYLGIISNEKAYLTKTDTIS